jgi:hypothetical protein
MLYSPFLDAEKSGKRKEIPANENEVDHSESDRQSTGILKKHAFMSTPLETDRSKKRKTRQRGMKKIHIKK